MVSISNRTDRNQTHHRGDSPMLGMFDMNRPYRVSGSPLTNYGDDRILFRRDVWRYAHEVIGALKPEP